MAVLRASCEVADNDATEFVADQGASLTMPRFIGSITQYPARVSIAWYFGLIVFGGVILTLPICHVMGRDPVALLDGLFTSASAACVTGLVVRSTGNDFSMFGQAIILTLIQLGGIGIMTVTTFVTFGWRRRQGLRERTLISETLGADQTADIRWVLRNVIGMTLAFEAIGFVILFVRNLFDFPPGMAAWHALFHSISAFCNAGFALFDDSLVAYQSDIVVNATVSGLIIAGGLGFPVMFDLRQSRSNPKGERWRRLHIHSKFMLLGTGALIAGGWLAVLALEWDHQLRGLCVPQKLLAALFHSVTTRTAGFNTIDVGRLTNATLFITILLMTIGAGPCSTAGGFKVSTLLTMLARGWTTMRGHARINLFRRTIPTQTVDRAIVTATMFAATSVAGLLLLLVFEQAELPHPRSQGLFLDALFEVVSALGTVGLSTGMTPNLTSSGRIVVIALMFLGRLGPISVVVAMSRGEQPQPIEMPLEEPLIG